MKPDAYMPFYGGDFLSATSGMSDACFRCYLRAIWHYWHHSHCEGLKNDSEELRRICCADRENWDEVYEQIFNDEFFYLGEDDKWHQKRAYEEWQKSSEQYQKVLDRAKAGASARWSKRKKASSQHIPARRDA
jgi:uncharacterized protein YdaU (DUF1376 family)